MQRESESERLVFRNAINTSYLNLKDTYKIALWLETMS